MIILLAGFVAAPVILFTAKSDEPRGILGIDIRTNRERSQLERMGGKSYVLFKDLDDWFDSLWHGRRLGWTIGVMSALGFLICRGLARVHEDYQLELALESAKRVDDPIVPAKDSTDSGRAGPEAKR